MALDLQPLKDAAAKIDTVKDSVIAFIDGLAAQIADLAAKAVTPEEKASLQSISDGLSADGDAIAASIVAHTPAA